MAAYKDAKYGKRLIPDITDAGYLFYVAYVGNAFSPSGKYSEERWETVKKSKTEKAW